MAEVWRDRFRVWVGGAVFILSPLRFGKLATAGNVASRLNPAVRGTEINVRPGLLAETGLRSPDSSIPAEQHGTDRREPCRLHSQHRTREAGTSEAYPRA